MSVDFRIEPLVSAHERRAFDCGSPALDAYLRERATQEMRRLVASCFVAVDEADGRVAGFYTLSAASVRSAELPSESQRRLPRYPFLPAALIGRLAVDKTYKGRGLGSAMIANAALRVIRSDVKAFAILVDAKDENAAAFYMRHGFLPLLGRPLSLFLPLETFFRGV